MDYDNIKRRLKNVYFINGTAYAGKSTICKLLSQKYNMFHCEENYMFDKFLEQTTITSHPNMNYFKTMKSWEEFISRTKEDYATWIDGVSTETTPFEIDYLLSISDKYERIIVDTNIPPNILNQISDSSHVLYMTADTYLAVNHFFDRIDKDKNFLLNIINQSSNKESFLKHYRKTLEFLFSEERQLIYKTTNFSYIHRVSLEESIEDKLVFAEKVFGLTPYKN